MINFISKNRIYIFLSDKKNFLKDKEVVAFDDEIKAGDIELRCRGCTHGSVDGGKDKINHFKSGKKLITIHNFDEVI